MTLAEFVVWCESLEDMQEDSAEYMQLVWLLVLVVEIMVQRGVSLDGVQDLVEDLLERMQSMLSQLYVLRGLARANDQRLGR